MSDWAYTEYWSFIHSFGDRFSESVIRKCLIIKAILDIFFPFSITYIKYIYQIQDQIYTLIEIVANFRSQKITSHVFT